MYDQVTVLFNRLLVERTFLGLFLGHSYFDRDENRPATTNPIVPTI